MEVEVAGVELNTEEVTSLGTMMMMRRRRMLIFVMILIMIMIMMVMMMMEVTSLETIFQIFVTKKMYLCLYCQNFDFSPLHKFICICNFVYRASYHRFISGTR